MTPNTDDRIASVIRALNEVILPHLPPEASLALEQGQLAIGHLQILRAQLDHVPAFEAEELADAKAIGTELAGGVTGGKATAGAIATLHAAVIASLPAGDAPAARKQRQAIHDAIEALVRAVAVDGDAAGKSALHGIILTMELARSQKDRKWFAPFGFDTI
ncbi:hypothetical protein [Novosphingobium lentum]|uniref:hypothetical protein n=1 Tax=Novosphingobium lentum TaxID=145287 RepID=UPI000834CB09|nr:hypothetical protein [Novosphingobium lentum]